MRTRRSSNCSSTSSQRDFPRGKTHKLKHRRCPKCPRRQGIWRPVGPTEPAASLLQALEGTPSARGSIESNESKHSRPESAVGITSSTCSSEGFFSLIRNAFLSGIALFLLHLFLTKETKSSVFLLPPGSLSVRGRPCSQPSCLWD